MTRGRPCRDELTFGALADSHARAESKAITLLFVCLPQAGNSHTERYART